MQRTEYTNSRLFEIKVYNSELDPIHLPEKYLPEITFPRKTLGRNYIIPNIHFPERAFSRNYISRKLICQNLHLPECTFGRNYISQKAYFSEITFPQKFIFWKLFFIQKIILCLGYLFLISITNF